MDVRLTLSLPRDARYVPVVRGIAERLLAQAGVPVRVVGDITLALTEACANAVRHAAGVEEYSVALHVGDVACEVEIVDLGPGFDLALTEVATPEHESGRGILLIRALVDDLQFTRDRSGMRVRLVKRWDGLPPPRAAAGRADLAAAAPVAPEDSPSAAMPV